MLWIVIPSDHNSSEVVKPGKQAFDLPAALVTTERAPILGRRIFAIPYQPMGRDHLDPSFLAEPLIEAIAIVGLVADHSFRLGLGEAGIKRFLDERDFMWRSACCPDGDRKTMALRKERGIELMMGKRIATPSSLGAMATTTRSAPGLPLHARAGGESTAARVSKVIESLKAHVADSDERST